MSSGLLVKVAGAGVNLLAVPIALRTLGPEKYASFAALLGLASWLALGNLGLGGATSVLTSEVADAERRRELFWRIVVSSVIAVAVIGAIAFLPFIVLSGDLLPGASPELARELTVSAYYCFAASIVMAVGAIFQGYYLGTLRIGYVNRCTLVGQCAAILALLTLPRLFGHMVTICVCVTLGTVATAVWLIGKTVVECPPPRPLNYRFRQSIPLFREGLGFFASALSTLFYTGASLWLIGRTFGMGELATAAVMARIAQIYLSVLALLLIPLAPALRNALAAGDRGWVRKALLRAGALMGVTGICAACGLMLLGRVIITRWTGTELPALSDWLVPLAAMTMSLTWAYFWIYVCFAVRGSLPVAILAVIEVAAVSAQFYLFGGDLAPSSSMFIMAGTMMTFSGTVLPIIVVKDFRRPRWRRHSSEWDKSMPATPRSPAST